MIWTRADLEVKQIPVKSSDITAVLVWLPQCTILLISVYVQGADPDASRSAILHIGQAIASVRQRVANPELIVAGDFNRHDFL